jgi:hypothetical protein
MAPLVLSNYNLNLEHLFRKSPVDPSAIAKVTAVDELMLREFLAKYSKKEES